MKQTKSAWQTAHCRRNAVKHGMYACDIYSVRHYLRALLVATVEDTVRRSHDNNHSMITAAALEVHDELSTLGGG